MHVHWDSTDMAEIEKTPNGRMPLEKWYNRLKKLEFDGAGVVRNHVQELRDAKTALESETQRSKDQEKKLIDAQEDSTKREVELEDKMKHLQKKLDDAESEVERLNGLVRDKNMRLNQRLQKLKESRAKMKQKSDDYQELDKGYQDLNKNYLSMKEMTDATKFVSILVDEDSMRFRDDLVSKGEQGGGEAALYLRESIIKHIKTFGWKPVGYLDPKVIVLIFRSKLVDQDSSPKRMMDERRSMTPFKRGFNMVEPSFNFMVTGTSKDLTLQKLRAMFELQVRDVHCGHVILGGTSDEFHKAILQHEILYPYNKETQPTRKRITLLRVARAPDWRVDLSRRFKTTRFEDVFQDT